MLERILYSVLAEEVASLKAGSSRELERLFRRQRNLSQSEAVKLADLFKRLPPNIIHNYPREDSALPLYALVLGDERETTKFLDDFGNFVSAEDAELLGDPSFEDTIRRATIFTNNYVLWTVTDSPDATIAYYQVAKNIMLKRRDFLKGCGVLDMVMAGSDVAPTQAYMPTYAFIRQLTLTCMVEENAYEERSELPIRSVRGIHVDDGRDAEEIGNVVANVTIIED